jgi:hypothetical protein
MGDRTTAVPLFASIQISFAQPREFANANMNMSLRDLFFLVFDGRCGIVVEILAYYARVRGVDSCTVQTFVCMNMSVCIGSGCFYSNMYLQKKCM